MVFMKPVFIFDVGGVLLKWRNNDPIYYYISKKYAIGYSVLRKKMIQRLPDLESGKIDADEYMDNVLSSFGKQMKPNETGSQLMQRPFKRLAELKKGTVRIIKNLKNNGYCVYALSNTSKPHLEIMKKMSWIKLFDGFYVSCNLGSVKPQQLTYKKVCKSIGVKPNNVVYVDDDPKNILSAKLCGISNAIEFKSVKQLKNDLSKISPLS